MGRLGLSSPILLSRILQTSRPWRLLQRQLPPAQPSPRPRHLRLLPRQQPRRREPMRPPLRQALLRQKRPRQLPAHQTPSGTATRPLPAHLWPLKALPTLLMLRALQLVRQAPLEHPQLRPGLQRPQLKDLQRRPPPRQVMRALRRMPHRHPRTLLLDQPRQRPPAQEMRLPARALLKAAPQPHRQARTSRQQRRMQPALPLLLLLPRRYRQTPRLVKLRRPRPTARRVPATLRHRMSLRPPNWL